jgi:hypothetical protein
MIQVFEGQDTYGHLVATNSNVIFPTPLVLINHQIGA